MIIFPRGEGSRESWSKKYVLKTLQRQQLFGQICGLRPWCITKKLVRLKRLKKSWNMDSQWETYLSKKAMLNISYKDVAQTEIT